MSDYTQVTDFSAKDALTSGDPEKIIAGADVDAELAAISTAIATKANSASPTLTGTITINGATVAGDATFSGAITHSGATTFSGAVTVTNTHTLQSTDAGASAGPTSILDRNSASPAASDVLGAVAFKGRDSGGGTDTYAQVQAEIVDATAASEDGKLAFQTMVAGALGTAGYVAQGLVLGSPTGGDKGAGTLNLASNLYINGSIPFGWKLIGTGSASAAAAADITSGIDSTYSRYKLILTNVVPATNNVNVYMRVSTDGGSSFIATASYDWGTYGYDGGGSVLDSSALGGNAMVLTGNATNVGGINNLSTQSGQFTIEFDNPSSSSVYKPFQWVGTWFNNRATPSISRSSGSGYYKATTAIDAVRILPNSGNITLNWALYGMV